ncbi:MAG: PHP domain-containing protein [Ruminococcaceae bacterium]|nr:PHP domain-containing protein [Oscillospiraceae bacterium]
MIINYHTHTVRCRHAAPVPDAAYVEAALEMGFRELGFSDHVPYPFEDLHISGCRMRCADLPDYMESLTALKTQYAGRIDIHIGFEAEYYPAYFDKLLEMLAPYPCEYLILGQHFINNEIGEPYNGRATDSSERMRIYGEQCKRAMDTGRFTYFAHPDVLHFTGDEAVFRQVSRDLCRAAKDCGLPLEFNLLGFIENRHYPRREFWEEAACVGNEVILGWDSHQPEWIKQPQKEAEARAYLAELGLSVLDHLTLVDPFLGKRG